MLSTIVLPLDGSSFAARAVPFASRIAQGAGARLVLVRAHEPLRQARGETISDVVQAVADSERAESELAAVAEHVADEVSLPREVVYAEGTAADVILVSAAAAEADLIVMSTHAAHGVSRWVRGSVADEVLRGGQVPLLLVSPTCEFTWHPDRRLRVLVGLDGSAFAAEALGVAGELTIALGGELLLLGVVKSSRAGVFPRVASAGAPGPTPRHHAARRYLEDLAANAQRTGIAASVRVGQGRPATTISRIAAEAGADVIAMATHGRGGLTRFMLGSVATELLRRVSVPILLVRPSGVR